MKIDEEILFDHREKVVYVPEALWESFKQACGAPSTMSDNLRGYAVIRVEKPAHDDDKDGAWQCIGLAALGCVVIAFLFLAAWAAKEIF